MRYKIFHINVADFNQAEIGKTIKKRAEYFDSVMGWPNSNFVIKLYFMQSGLFE